MKGNLPLALLPAITHTTATALKMAPPVHKAEQRWKYSSTAAPHQAKRLKEDLAGQRAAKSDRSQIQLSKKFLFTCK